MTNIFTRNEKPDAIINWIVSAYVDEKQDIDFDPMDPCTMTFYGVSTQFCYHRRRDNGKDELVVLTVGTSED